MAAGERRGRRRGACARVVTGLAGRKLPFMSVHFLLAASPPPRRLGIYLHTQVCTSLSGQGFLAFPLVSFPLVCAVAAVRFASCTPESGWCSRRASSRSLPRLPASCTRLPGNQPTSQGGLQRPCPAPAEERGRAICSLALRGLGLRLHALFAASLHEALSGAFLARRLQEDACLETLVAFREIVADSGCAATSVSRQWDRVRPARASGSPAGGR